MARKWDGKGSSPYDLQVWRAKPHGLRWRTLLRDHFTCTKCGRLEGDTSKLHVDHKQAHKGDLTLFFDPHNVTTLCERCHNSDKQRLEKSGRTIRQVGADGYPLR